MTPTHAEELPVGTKVKYAKPPNVEPAIGELPFAAPSSEGMVVDHTTSHGVSKARIRFTYTTPSGRKTASDPLTVERSQSCEVVTDGG